MIEPGLKKFMKNSTLEKSKKRVWEIDALRGLLMVCVLGTHLYYTVEAFCINGVYNIDPYNYVRISDPLRVWFDWGADGVIYKSFLTPELRGIWTNMGVDCFFVISGWGASCTPQPVNNTTTANNRPSTFFITVMPF